MGVRQLAEYATARVHSGAVHCPIRTSYSHTDIMLAKRNRLSKREFDTLLKKGRRVHGDSLSLIILPSPVLKCGVVVSKKTARNATARNLIRRRVYGILKNGAHTLPPLWIAVLTRPSVTKLSYAELETQLTQLLVKSRV